MSTSINPEMEEWFRGADNAKPSGKPEVDEDSETDPESDYDEARVEDDGEGAPPTVPEPSSSRDESEAS